MVREVVQNPILFAGCFDFLTEHFKNIENKIRKNYTVTARRDFMKFRFFIDKERDEEVIVYAHKKIKLIEDIENLVAENSFELMGFLEREAVKLDLADVYCFISENNKIYAVCEQGKYLLRLRLYQLEENLSENFIKINQSCIANIRKMKKFDASFTGTLTVIFKNGYKDYVSRRNVKRVKERLGL